jgi:hypothetical protein
MNLDEVNFEELGLLWPILFVFLLFVNLAPWFVAIARQHRNSGAILVLVLLLGWTIIGWTVALIWAMYRDKDDPPLGAKTNPFDPHHRPRTPHF